MRAEKTASRSWSSRVHAHKLLAPAMTADAVERGRILAQVFAHGAARVIVLQAPAGHGKSTTLLQIKAQAESMGWRCGWLTLDDADNDSRRFILHLYALVAAACGQGASRGGESAVQRVRGDAILDALCAASGPVALFFDEFHALSDARVLALCRDLFERLPDRVRVFIGSRTVPDVGLPRLQVSGRARILNADDLRFSQQEVQRFFADGALQGGFSADEIDTIYRRTEGWPAAVQLFRLSLPSPDVRRALEDPADPGPRALTDYLSECVLALQPDDIQTFLCRTALLNRMSASLCAAVTGRTDAQALLEALERAGLFVRALDPQPRWFRYHALFASFLAQQFATRDPEGALDVHQRAANWCFEHHDYEEALHHAMAAGDHALAADVLEHWAEPLVSSGQLVTVARAYEALPFEVVAERLPLAIKAGYALVFLRHREALQKLLPLLEAHAGCGDIDETGCPDVVLSMAAVCADDLESAFAIVDRVSVRDRPSEGFAAFELGAAANLVAYRHAMLGDLERADHYIAQARAYSQRGDALFSGGYTAAIGGMNLLARGDLTAALAHFRAVAPATQDPAEESLAAAATVSCHLWALYEANQLEAVEAAFGRHHDAIADAVLLDFLAVAVLAIARTYDASDRPEQARRHLEQAEDIARVNGWQRLVRIVTWERLRRHLVVGEFERARALLDTIDLARANDAVWSGFSEEVGADSLGRLRLQTHIGDPAMAAAALAEAEAACGPRGYRRLRLRVLQALLARRLRDDAGAVEAMCAAVEIGFAGGGYIRAFLDEGPEVPGLLRAVQEKLAGTSGRDDARARAAYVGQLLQAAGVEVDSAVDAADPAEALTPRELEILRAVAAGASNRLLADQMHLSENTVKYHLKNVYAKLGVHNRVRALAVARRQGWLS